MATRPYSAMGKIGGLVKAAKDPPQELTRAARAGFLAKFERQAEEEALANGQGVLAPEETQRRAKLLHRAFMKRISLSRTLRHKKPQNNAAQR